MHVMTKLHRAECHLPSRTQQARQDHAVPGTGLLSSPVPAALEKGSSVD